MVRIKYATTRTIAAGDVIAMAIQETSAKFDNNIQHNRFEQINGHYEVTIKCISSRGKGAKRGASGRRTISCCYHVWGVFFDELFRLNPNIVIISMGNRITSQSHVGWADREPDSQCDCPTPLEEDTDRAIDELIAERAREEALRIMTTMGADVCSLRVCPANTNGHCNYVAGDGTIIHPDCARFPQSQLQTTVVRDCETCRYSRLNTANGRSQCPPSESGCRTSNGLPQWEEYIPPQQPNRTCSTCMYSRHNTSNGETQCPPGRCLDSEGLQNWMPYAPVLQPTPEPVVAKMCINCEYSHDADGNNRSCHPIIGWCIGKSKWKLYQPFVIVGTPKSRYDTQMVEQDTQVEQVVEFPMLREE